MNLLFAAEGVMVRASWGGEDGGAWGVIVGELEGRVTAPWLRLVRVVEFLVVLPRREWAELRDLS